MNTPTAASLAPSAFTQRPVPPEMLAALRERFAERCSTALAVREQHGRDESPFDVPPPEVVVFCESTEDVADVVKLADRHAVPVIAFGAGSSIEGHVLAVQCGLFFEECGFSKTQLLLFLHNLRVEGVHAAIIGLKLGAI